MANDRHDERTEGSRYGPISTRTQAAQTLPVQTQPPTQLMSHEVHQYTQLVQHDLAEHVRGDTLVNDSEVEVSGDTVVLNDDDGELHGVVDSVPNEKGLMIKSVENGLNSDPHIHRDLPDSDATTEEGDVGNAGYLDTDAESRPPHTEAPPDDEGAKTGDALPTFTRSSLPEVEGGTENFNRQDTPQDALVAATNGLKNSQSRPRSISSVRAASLRASGLRAAGRSASLNSAGKDGVKFDSESTIDLTPGILDGFETELRGIEDVRKTTEAEFDSMQSSPKVTVPFDDALACMSTSRSKSKSVSPTLEHASGFTDNAPSEQGINNHIDSDATLIAEKPKSGSHDPENTSAPIEPLSLGLKRLRSQASILSSIGGSDARPGADLKVQTGQLNSQKARKLVFDDVETYPKFGGGEGDTVSKALNTDLSSAFNRQISGIQAPARQGSVPSGVRAVSTNLSYLESQDPGEESQMNALNVVDKLVWLDASCMPDDVATSHVPQDGSVKCHAGIKGLQSLAQAAQMKAVHDKLDVFDWEDSQLDEDSSPDKRPVPVNVRARKRQVEAPKLTMSSKKQAISHQKKAQSIPPCLEKIGLKSTLGVDKPEVPNVEPLGSGKLQDVEMKPHTLLTSRLRNRTKAEYRLPSKGRQSPSLQRGRRKRVGMEKQTNELSKELETGQQRAENNIKSKVQQAAPESGRRAGRNKSIYGSGRHLKVEQQKERVDKEGKRESVKTSEIDTNPQSGLGFADRTSQDDAAADIWIEAFSNAKNKTPMDNNVDLIKFKKRSALHDETGQGLKKSRTVEPSPVTRDVKRLNTSEQEEVFTGEDKVRSGSESQKNLKKSKIIDAATSALQHISRRVSTRLSKGEQQNLDTGKELIDRDANVRQKSKKSKKSKVSDARRLKGSSPVEHRAASEKELNVLEKDEAEREPQTEQEAEQNETADRIGKGRKCSSHGSEVEHVSSVQDKAVEKLTIERGPKTRSQAQDIKSKSSSTQGTATKKIVTSLSEEAVQADFAMDKPSTKPGKLRKKESLMSYQQSTASVEEAPAVISTRSTRGREAVDGSIPESVKAREEIPAQSLKRSKRGREDADASVPESAKDREDAVSQPGRERNTNKFLQHTEELRSQEDDVSGALRRTRRSTNKGGFERNESVNAVKDAQVRGDLTSEEQGLKDQVVKSTTRTSKPLPRQNKKMKALRALSSSSVVDEGRRRKRESGEIRVLFSHSLTEETIKHQKKVLAKLGGHIAMSALECTHFISNGFVRSQNMLISMAAGKIVATTLWLESCGLAHYFVDEKNYILHDEKKEKELGFSMTTSLAAARRKPLFKDVKVIICSNTIPEPTALKAIVESAGGQVMDARTCLSQSDIEGDKPLIVIATEKGLDTCSQFLIKGLKVYSEELVLQGVVTQTLDFSRNHLFEDFKQQRGLRRT